MPRGGKTGIKQNNRKKIDSCKASDESDEDYVVKEDEELDDFDDGCSSFEEDESEEILELEDKEDVRVARPKTAKKGFVRKRIKRVKRPTRRREIYREEEEEEEEEEVEQDKEEEEDDDDEYNQKEEEEVAEEEEEYDEVEEEEDEEEDDEFISDETDSLDDEVQVRKKNKYMGKRCLQRKSIYRGKKRRRNSKVLQKAASKKPRKNHRLVRKARSSNRRLVTTKKRVGETSKKTSCQEKRRLSLDCDSDFTTSGSPDFEYTVSEEEREQVREAGEFCQSLATSLRSSSLMRRLQNGGQDREVVLQVQQKQSGGCKGKEKVEELKKEIGKQVCGICLSEEDKKIVRGTLNCCSHYFCFACIMEWSEVESRCPLCKQRFVTISKPARSSTGNFLRTVAIPVPERDQVYQPSEEELRGYLDPYENVICTECQQGGDDALMLLCDLCDSPAHTYCVGLGHEVPEGNWYCEGCRPTAPGCSNPRDSNSEQRSNLFGGSSLVGRADFDLNVTYVPDSPSTQETLSSIRRTGGDIQVASPSSGSGAITVSDRRRIQRQIHDFISNRIRQSVIRSNGLSATMLGNGILGAQANRQRELAPQRVVNQERTASNSTFFEERQRNSNPSIMQNRDFISARARNSSDRFIQNQTYTSASGVLPVELANINLGINARQAYEQLLSRSTRSSIRSDATLSALRSREVICHSVEVEQLKSMVSNHLKSLSKDMELGHITCKDIARSAIHTILAACGLGHQQSEVYPVDPPSICNHIERMTGGQTSLMRGHCAPCFDLFVRDVVRKVMNSRVL